MRLRSFRGLYHYTPAICDFHKQAVLVHQGHAHEGVYANRPGLDVSRLAVPEYRDAVYVEGSLAAVGQDRLAITNDRQPQVRHQHRWQRQLAIEAGIIHGVDFPRLLRRIQQGNGYDSFEIGVHHTLDHLALLRELPPK